MESVSLKRNEQKSREQMLPGIIRGADILRLLGSGLRIFYIAVTDGRYGGAMAEGDGSAVNLWPWEWRLTRKKQLIIKCRESLYSIEDFKKRKGKAG